MNLTMVTFAATVMSLVWLVVYLFRTLYIDFDETGLKPDQISHLREKQDHAEILFVMLDGYYNNVRPQALRDGFDLDTLHQICGGLIIAYRRKFKEKLLVDEFVCEEVVDRFIKKYANTQYLESAE